MEAAAKKAGYVFDGVHAPVDDNDNYSVAYSQFVVPLVKAVQELSNQNDSLQNANQKQQAQVDALILSVSELKKQNEQLLSNINEIYSLIKGNNNGIGAVTAEKK